MVVMETTTGWRSHKREALHWIESHHCAKKGHYKSNCPELRAADQGVQNLNQYRGTTATTPTAAAGVQNICVEEAEDGHRLAQEQGVRGILSEDHVYINTCATYASTPYPELLSNVKKEKRGLIGHTNAGSTRMELAGNLGAVPKMWVNKGGVATIIPLKVLEKIWRATYDSTRNGGRFVVWSDQGNIVLNNNKGGMPYFDLKKPEAEVALSLLHTVRGNKEGYTRREFNEAHEAQKAQAMVGHPMDQDFLGMLVRANMILNCPSKTQL